MSERSEGSGSRDCARVASSTGSTLPDADHYTIAPPCTHEEFLAVAKVYARAVVRAADLSVEVSALEWKVSTRAKRRAGALTYRGDEPVRVTLAWKQFEQRGWSATASTIRHELLHAHLLNEGVGPGHGPEFRRLAQALETNVHCERFTDPTWWVHCTDCSHQIARYRRSKLVSNPEQYRCGECGGRLRVERNDSQQSR